MATSSPGQFKGVVSFGHNQFVLLVEVGVSRGSFRDVILQLLVGAAHLADKVRLGLLQFHRRLGVILQSAVPLVLRSSEMREKVKTLVKICSKKWEVSFTITEPHYLVQ